MDEINPFEGIFSPTEYDVRTPALQVQPGNAPGIQTPVAPVLSFHSAATTPNGTLLRLLDVPEPREKWDEDGIYDEDPPRCIHYSIEWRVNVNGKPVSKADTEQDLVLNPAAYWQEFLRFRVERLLQRKLGRNHTAKMEDINVVVSVTARSERDLTKQFELEIDWRVVEKQLVQWSNFFQDGKKLRVDVTFNYVDSTGQPRRGGKKASSSATQRMLSDLDTETNAEKESSGETPGWNEVYRVMRCPGPPCDLGPHCWRDPDGKKHYRLYPHHLRSLNKYVQAGGRLQCQDDVPKAIREEFYAEEQQRSDRKQSNAVATPHGMTPITINNHFPEHSQPMSRSSSHNESSCSDKASSTSLTGVPLDIPGHLDTAVREYREYQKSLVHDPLAKAQVDKACNVVLAKGLDLNQLHGDQDYEFLVQEDVNVGTARRFVGGISDWVKRRKCE